MAFHPSSKQQRTINDAMRAPSYRRAGAISKLALFEALGTEANYLNPPGGDRDSVGSLQQRGGWGSAASRLNVTDSAERFLQHAIPLEKKARNSGELAQLVQRSAFPGRYIQHHGEAEQILRDSGGSLGGGGGGSSTTTETSQLPQLSGLNAPALMSLIQQVQRPQPQPANLPPPPAFTAQAPSVPQGYQPPPAVGIPPAPQTTAADIVSALAAAPPPQSGSVTTTTTTGGGGGGSVSSRDGKVNVASGANLPGKPIQRVTLDYVKAVAGLRGQPITIGTGTNHSRLTVNGKVSDHSTGNAADLPVPVDSQLGDRIAMRALEVAGISPKQAAQMARRGGLFTLTPSSGQFKGRRVQVIWKTNEGGNHHNHVHIGVR